MDRPGGQSSATPPNAIPPIAVTMGDPGGCGPQITLEAWRRRNQWKAPPFYVIANHDVMVAADHAGTPMQRIEAPFEAVDCFDAALPILDIDCPLIVPGDRDASGATSTIRAIEMAVAHVRDNQASALVTNPINKALLYEAGFSHPGHTEFLAQLAQSNWLLDDEPMPVMLLTGGGLRVALATIHTPLKDVPDSLTAERIIEIASRLHDSLIMDFGITSPRIAVAGLNPHAGEEGALGHEEQTIINPVCAQLRTKGYQISDAMPGDTVFASMLEGDWDAVIAMYHDQGLAPLKTLDMWGGVNATIGLPFIRTSPDHGTAYEAAAKRSARPDSLIAAIRQASDMVRSRANHGCPS